MYLQTPQAAVALGCRESDVRSLVAAGWAPLGNDPLAKGKWARFTPLDLFRAGVVLEMHGWGIALSDAIAAERETIWKLFIGFAHTDVPAKDIVARRELRVMRRPSGLDAYIARRRTAAPFAGTILVINLEMLALQISNRSVASRAANGESAQ